MKSDLEIIDNPKLLLKLEAWWGLKKSNTAYGKLDKEVKKELKGKNAKIGNFYILSRTYERENKAKKKEVTEVEQTKILKV